MDPSKFREPGTLSAKLKNCATEVPKLVASPAMSCCAIHSAKRLRPMYTLSIVINRYKLHVIVTYSNI